MTVQLATQTLARFAPEAIKAAQGLLTKLATQEAAQVVDVATQAGASLSTSTSLADGGVSQAVHLARQGLYGDLESFAGLLNGELPRDKKDLIFEIIGLGKEGKALSPEHSKNLREILEHVASNPVVSSNGTSSADGIDQDTELNVDEVSRETTAVGDKDTSTNGPEKDKPHRQKKQRFYTEEEVEQLVQERLQKLGMGGDGVPKDPIDKILKGVSGIALGEIRNKNSFFGLLVTLYGKVTGNEINRDTVNKFLGSFVDDKFKGKLSSFIEAKVGGKTLDETFYQGMSDFEKTGIKSVGKLIGLANYVPDWAFDAIAASGQFVDTFAELLHHIPVLGGILKIPFVRKFYADFSAFVGRFTATGDLQLISQGAKDLKAKLNPNPKQA